MIWVKRTDWSYEYFLERPASETEEFSAFCNQIVQYVRSQESFKHFPSKNSIQTFMATIGKKQKTTRDAIDTLLAEARLIIKTKPAGEKAPGPKSYIGTPGKGDTEANETSQNKGSDTMDEETQGPPGQEDGVDLVKISTTANEVSEKKGSDTMDESLKKNTSLPIGNKGDDEVSSPPFPAILETSLTESTKSDEVNEVSEGKKPDITSGDEPECLARSGEVSGLINPMEEAKKTGEQSDPGCWEEEF